MFKVYTCSEVARRLGISVVAVRSIAREILFVPRIERDFFWTEKYIKRAQKILQFGRGELTEL